MVQIILARRAEGDAGAEAEISAVSESAVASSGLLDFTVSRRIPQGLKPSFLALLRSTVKPCPDTNLIRCAGTINRSQFLPQHGTGEQHGVEFRAHQDDQGDHVHPDQQRDGGAERSVNNAVVGVMP
jgi:hypothetical protein